MSYQRKTFDEWQLMSSYDGGRTWECECTEATRKDARELLKCYRENSTGRHYIRKVRVRFQDTPPATESRMYVLT